MNAPRIHLPGATCVYGPGRRITPEELATIQQFQDWLRLRKEIGGQAACAEVYGHDCPHYPGQPHPADPNPRLEA